MKFSGKCPSRAVPRRVDNRQIFDRIACDPNVLAGKACIRRLRIPVSLIVGLAARGATIEEILSDHPHLGEADIRQALAYAATAIDF